MYDIIGCNDMVQGTSTFFTGDRQGKLNSALNLNMGYTTVSSGAYFGTSFTFSTWVYPQSLGYYSRIIDFSQNGYDNIVWTFNSYIGTPYLGTFNNALQVLLMNSPNPITVGLWQFIAFTFDGANGKVYLNGQTIAIQYNAPSMRIVTRTHNYFGKSFNLVDGYSSSVLDDLRIYNRCLTDAEIFSLYNFY